MKYVIITLISLILIFFILLNKKITYSYLLSIDNNKVLSLYKYNDNYKLKKIKIKNNITLENIIYDSENILVIGHDSILNKDMLYKINKNNDELEIYYEPQFNYSSLSNLIVYDNYYYLLIDFNLYRVSKDFKEETLLIKDISNSCFYIDNNLIIYRSESLGIKSLYSYNLGTGIILNLGVDGVIRGINNDLVLFEKEDGYYLYNTNDKTLYLAYEKQLYSSIYLDDISYKDGFLVVNSSYPWDDIKYFSLKDNTVINETLYEVEDKMIINQFRLIDNNNIYIEEIDICTYELLDPMIECEARINRFLYNINTKEKISLNLIY